MSKRKSRRKAPPPNIEEHPVRHLQHLLSSLFEAADRVTGLPAKISAKKRRSEWLKALEEIGLPSPDPAKLKAGLFEKAVAYCGRHGYRGDDLEDRLHAVLTRIFWLSVSIPGETAGVPWDQGDSRHLDSHLHDLKMIMLRLVGEEVKKEKRPTISRVGDRQFRVNSSEDIRVTQREDQVLQVFIGRHALDHPTLVSTSMCEDAPKILKRLCEKHSIFGPAIVFPGAGYSGGYQATVVQETMLERDEKADCPETPQKSPRNTPATGNAANR